MTMLRARLFGGLMLRWDGGSLPPIAGTVPRSLLAYLLTYRDRAHTRSLLAGTFWPDLPEEVARRRLSQALWRIRKALAPHPVLRIEGDTVQINPALPLWLDIEQFARERAQCLAENAGGASQPVGPCESCLAHYRGDFLAGYYEDWLFPERERLREQMLDVLERLVARYKREGNYLAALAHARRLAAEDLLREEAHREVMRLCHLLGRDVEALQQFETCRQALQEELGVEPSPTTVALARRVAEQSDQAAQADLPWAPRPPAVSGPDAPLAREVPLLGRERERAEMLAHVDALLQGLGAVVLLEGEAGVGKTRFLQAIASDAEWRGVEVLWGSEKPAETALPYGALVEALSGGLSPLRARQLAQLVEGIWLQALTALLSPLGSAWPDLPPAPSLEPAQERDRLVNALAQLLVGWARIAPVLLVLDDLHWAGPAMLDLLARLAPALRPGGLLVLGSYRSEDARTSPEIWQGLQALDRAGVQGRLALARLDAAASGELIRRSLGRPAPHLEARLFAETAGNPLFLLETLRALSDEGLLGHDEKGQWRIQEEGFGPEEVEIPLPAAVEETIARRLEALAPAARETLTLAAVLGERFDFDLLHAASRTEPARLLANVRKLVQRRFLEEADQAYRFHHDKIRQVVYSRVREGDRPKLHRRVAQALACHQPEQVAALAHHWLSAGDWDQAATYHKQAGDQARAVYANAEAAAHYRRALGALEQLPTRPEPARLWDLRWASEEVHARLGERERQREDLAVLEALAEQLEDGQRQMQVGLRMAEYYMDRGDPQAARPILEGSLPLARTRGEVEIEARALNLLGQVHQLLGDPKQARQHNEQALDLHRAHGDLAGQARSLISCCVACLFGGDYLAAEAYGHEAQRLCHMLGDRKGEGQCLHLLGRVHRDQGRLAAAQACASEAVHIAREVGDRTSEAYHLLELGNLASNLGDYPSARETLQQAVTLFERIDDKRGYSYGLLDLGLVLHRLGQGSLARERVERAQSLITATGDQWGTAGGWTYRGLVLEGLGALTLAAEAFQQALALKREIDQQAWSLEDRAGLARVALAQERVAEALAHSTEILDRIDRVGLAGVEHPATVYLTLYRTLAAAGMVDRARAVLAEAYALVTERAEQIDDKGLRDSFVENVAEHRHIVAAYRALASRTVTMTLPRAGAPTGRALRDEEYTPVTWTVVAPEDEFLPAGPEWRQARLRRLLREAAEQGAAPRVGDLAAALGVSEPTVRRDLAALRRAGHPAETRGSRGP